MWKHIFIKELVQEYSCSFFQKCQESKSTQIFISRMIDSILINSYNRILLSNKNKQTIYVSNSMGEYKQNIML